MKLSLKLMLLILVMTFSYSCKEDVISPLEEDIQTETPVVEDLASEKDIFGTYKVQLSSYKYSIGMDNSSVITSIAYLKVKMVAGSEDIQIDSHILSPVIDPSEEFPSKYLGIQMSALFYSTDSIGFYFRDGGNGNGTVYDYKGAKL